MKIAFYSFALYITIIAITFYGSSANAAEEIKEYILTEKLLPGENYEECQLIELGRATEYRFQATQPVDFNIHYHVAKETFYPVEKKSVLNQADIFRSEQTRKYCWMWENKGEKETLVSYQIKKAPNVFVDQNSARNIILEEIIMKDLMADQVEEDLEDSPEAEIVPEDE